MRKLFLFVALLSLFALTIPAAAQDDGVIADGLNGPRAVFYDDSGALWIAEAGLGGDLTGESEFGPVSYGNTARVLRVEAGGTEAEVVIANLPSAQGFDDLIGVNSVYGNSDGLWLVIGMGPQADPFNNTVLNLDPETLRVRHLIDLATFETENNPDGDIPQANAGDITSDGAGTYYIVDFSGNSLLKWTADGGLELFHAWEDLPVPTSVAVAPDGSIYVGFLSAFPFAQGSARVEQWSAEGELLNTFGGLTGVTDVVVADDGTVYAVQLADSFGDLGWTASSGSVVTVGADGTITPVAEGLNYPYGLAISADGAMAVTVNSTFSPEGSGQVILLSGDMTTMPVDDSSGDAETEAEAPAETPEASGG